METNNGFVLFMLTAMSRQINFSDNRCHCICIENVKRNEIRKLIPHRKKINQTQFSCKNYIVCASGPDLTKNHRTKRCGLNVTEPQFG